MDDKVIKDMYRWQHLTMQQIADHHGVTRQAVQKRLRSLGVKVKDGTHFKLVCPECEGEFFVTRSEMRRRNPTFCSRQCWYRVLRNVRYSQWRQGQRISRAVVSKYFELDDGMIVHHVDFNSRNSKIENLMVFRNHSDHMKFHRSGRGKPVFIGARVKDPKAFSFFNEKPLEEW